MLAKLWIRWTGPTWEALKKRDRGALRASQRATGTVYLSDLALGYAEQLLGGRPAAVGPADVDAYMIARGQRVGPRSIRREVGCLRATWTRARRYWGHWPVDNPWTTSGLQVDQVMFRPLSLPEERSLLTELDRRSFGAYCWARVGFDSGARAGEISRLTWQDLDHSAELATIVSTATARTKTRRSRVVYVSAMTMEELDRWRLQRPVGVPRIWGREGERDRATADNMSRMIASASILAIGRRVTAQDLRRTVATRLAEYGASEALCAAALGHSDVLTTAQYYQRFNVRTIRALMRGARQILPA